MASTVVSAAVSVRAAASAPTAIVATSVCVAYRRATSAVVQADLPLQTTLLDAPIGAVVGVAACVVDGAGQASTFPDNAVLSRAA